MQLKDVTKCEFKINLRMIVSLKEPQQKAAYRDLLKPCWQLGKLKKELMWIWMKQDTRENEWNFFKHS